MKKDIQSAAAILKRFMNGHQIAAMVGNFQGEEGQYFQDKFIEIARTIDAMPKTYEQDGKGDKAVAYLHYFKGSVDAYITEKDIETEQHQAFGLVDIGYGPELGYVSIVELIANGLELDLHFEPTTIGEIKNK